MLTNDGFKTWLESIDHQAMMDNLYDDFVDWIYDYYHCNHEDQAMRYEEDPDSWETWLDLLPEDQIIYKETK